MYSHYESAGPFVVREIHLATPFFKGVNNFEVGLGDSCELQILVERCETACLSTLLNAVKLLEATFLGSTYDVH